MELSKYINLDTVLPRITDVLKDAIQQEVLAIRKIDRNCPQYAQITALHPEISQADYVVYSPHVRRSDHRFEHFVFLDIQGEKVCHTNGTEMELYGLLKPCTSLKLEHRKSIRN